MYKLQIYEHLKKDAINCFNDFCEKYKEIIPDPFNEYSCCAQLIENLKNDYLNFYQRADYQLSFLYPYELFKNQKGLKKDKYKKLLESSYTEEEKTYYVINSELKKIFENLDKSIDKTKYQTNLSVKQLFNYSYFIDSQPRCCFCGQLLEENRNTHNETYIIADIEHIFPKSKFPQFTLHIDNWAPCCKECNEALKKDEFFTSEPIKNFRAVLEDLHIDTDNMHPLKLWKLYTIDYDDNLNIHINKNCSKTTKEFLSYYGIEDRIKIMV